VAYTYRQDDELGGVLTATLPTWAFSADTRPHHVLLVGTVMLTVFLGIESRRYRVYDIWRSRVRLLEESVFANALEPEGVEQSNWRELLSEDFREPTIKTPAREVVSRRLRRVYLPLFSVLVGAWTIRLTVFAPPSTGAVETASVGGVPGEATVALVAAFYVTPLTLAFWHESRQAKGEPQSEENPEEWK